MDCMKKIFFLFVLFVFLYEKYQCMYHHMNGSKSCQNFSEKNKNNNGKQDFPKKKEF